MNRPLPPTWPSRLPIDASNTYEVGEFRVAIDVGGTFTDFVLFNERTQEVVGTKVLSTPSSGFSSIQSGFQKLGVDFANVGFFVHGTTAALNALLERRGAHVALITTYGFRDVYEIGRGNRPEMYDLHYHKPARLVPRRHIYEVRERIRHDGSVLQKLDLASLSDVMTQLEDGNYDSIAVCLLHAYSNPEHELMVEEALRERFPQLPISLSHRIAPEWREFERTSTVVMNAYVAPILESYLGKLEERAVQHGLTQPILIMQSTGGLMSSAAAKHRGVHTIMSGPAGGALGATALADVLDHPNLLCIDMGGTSFDMSLVVDGKPDVTTDTELAGFPLLVPTIDIRTIGAGGGSVAWEEGGGLRVGPRSAGAVPGPVCYGRGGQDPTVTDANLVLGRINGDYFLGGQMALDACSAHKALSSLGEVFGLSYSGLAEGICQVINTRMAGAIREITVQRGTDARDFYLIAFGGAGPLHAAFIAQELEISTVIIPRSPGTFSAWGMLQADLRRDFVRAYYSRMSDVDAESLGTMFEALEAEAIETLASENVHIGGVSLLRTADMRYVGQEHVIGVGLPSSIDGSCVERIPRMFHNAHSQRHGHCNQNEQIEFVNLRVAAIGSLYKAHAAPVERVQRKAPAATRRREVFFDYTPHDTPIYLRHDLHAGFETTGPAVIEEPSCTTVVPPQCNFLVDDHLHLVINVD